MSKGEGERKDSRSTDRGRSKNSRSSIPMSVERARAIQAHADRTGRNQDFKSRAMSAADRAKGDETD